MRRRRYRAVLLGHTWATGPTTETDTIREARTWAEGYGMLADRCVIYEGRRVVASHVRTIDGDGMRWYRATP